MINDDKERKGRLVLDAIANIDPDLICEAAPGEGSPERKQAGEQTTRKVRMLPVYVRIGAAAAAILLVAGVIAFGFFKIFSGSGNPGQPSGLKIASGNPLSVVAIANRATEPAPVTEAPTKTSPETSHDPEAETKSDTEATLPSKSYVVTFDPNGGSIISSDSYAAAYSVRTERINNYYYSISGWTAKKVTSYTAESETLAFRNASKGSDILDLRAASWNDNENPERFSELTTTQKVAFPVYGLDPTVRTAVCVKDTNAKQLSYIKVEAVYSDDGASIWSSYTNADGIAYLYFSDYDRPWDLRVYDSGGDVLYSRSGLTKHPETMDVYVDTSSADYDKTQVMFIFDTTGSMTDTLSYFQAWFEDITLCSDAANASYSLNFYRDRGEAYVTKTNGFETDPKVLTKTLNKVTAYGGGDEPEAVAEILTKTMNSDDWEADSRKIAFLIFDAPPHADKADEIREAVAQASAKGIRLIPVVASYAPDPELEYFARTLAVMTDGDYVLLTDTSASGSSSGEASFGVYLPSRLYSVIIELINKYGA